MKKICLLFLLALVTTLHSNDRHWENFKKKALPELSQIDGWCSKEKARSMMDLIHQTHPQVCVEIGVFGGSSIYPTAKALSYRQSGVVYAIDPWSNEECTQGYELGDPNYEWWSKVDLEKIYSRFLAMLTKYNLNNYCTVMRMTSIDACHHFLDDSIDILHIDGNHSEDSALQDAQLFLPKVKRGGFIWFDDANWTSTTKAIEFLNESCDMIPEQFVNHCVLFKKRM